MTDIDEARLLADRHLPGDYTIERVHFQDGDERIRATYRIGWEHGCRREHVLWCTREPPKLWIEYYESDVRRSRRRYRTGLCDRVI